MKGRTGKLNIDKGIIVLVLIVIVIAVSVTLLAFQLRSDKITDDIREKKLISLLVTVHDGGKLIDSRVLRTADCQSPQELGEQLVQIVQQWGVDCIHVVEGVSQPTFCCDGEPMITTLDRLPD